MRAMAALLLLFTLAGRLIVPAGFMPVETSRGLVVSLCTGDGARSAVIAIPMADEAGDHQEHRDKQPAPCAFAGLAAPALLGGGPLLVAPVALLLREIALPPPAQAVTLPRLRELPPLRGPPAAA
jgi:hypothetical protein